MELTRDFINKAKSLDEEMKKENSSISEELNNYKPNNQDKKRKVARQDGDVQMVKEKDLWEEIRYLGNNSDAYKTLKKAYPKIFERIEENDKRVEELKNLMNNNLGFTFDQMNFTRLIEIIENMVELKLMEKELIPYVWNINQEDIK